jgi:hypothetical protein
MTSTLGSRIGDTAGSAADAIAHCNPIHATNKPATRLAARTDGTLIAYSLPRFSDFYGDGRRPLNAVEL